MAKPKKSQVRKAAKRLFREEKKSKQEVFEILKNRFKNSDVVADVVSYVPSANRLQKYRIWEGFLIGNLVLIIIFLIWDYGLQFNLWPYGILLYGVLTRRVDYYLYISLIFGFLSLSFILIPIFGKPIPWIIVIKYLIPSLAAIGLAYFLEKRLCPQPKIEREAVDHGDGKKKYRIKYRFLE